MGSLEQDRERVMQAFEDGKPKTAEDISRLTGIRQSDISWACEVLWKNGELARIEKGKYALPQVSPPREPEEEEPVKRKRGERTAQVYNLTADGEIWSPAMVAEEIELDGAAASGVLTDLVKKGRLEKKGRGKYRRPAAREASSIVKADGTATVQDAETEIEKQGPFPDTAEGEAIEPVSAERPTATVQLRVQLYGVSPEAVAKMLRVLNGITIKERE